MSTIHYACSSGLESLLSVVLNPTYSMFSLETKTVRLFSFSRSERGSRLQPGLVRACRTFADQRWFYTLRRKGWEPTWSLIHFCRPKILRGRDRKRGLRFAGRRYDSLVRAGSRTNSRAFSSSLVKNKKTIAKLKDCCRKWPCNEITSVFVWRVLFLWSFSFGSQPHWLHFGRYQCTGAALPCSRELSCESKLWSFFYLFISPRLDAIIMCQQRHDDGFIEKMSERWPCFAEIFRMTNSLKNILHHIKCTQLYKVEHV